jgi:threonine dehydratase
VFDESNQQPASEAGFYLSKLFMHITIQQINEAAERLEPVVSRTPLQLSKRLSQKYGATVYLKREDLQEVRSFKIRGAYNKIVSLTDEERKKGVVTASAGNHAQGVAYSCSALKIRGTIFMPSITPTQKIDKVKHFGGTYVEIQLVGNTYDDASAASHKFCDKNGAIYVHPFNDPLTIAGQGTIGKEIYEDLEGKLDVLVSAIGGGGLISGISSYLKQKDSTITIIGAEPAGAPAMYEALKQKKLVTLETIDTFVDGAAVKSVKENTLAICQKNVKNVLLVLEGLICSVMIELYQNEGIIAEPAGALSVAALEEIKDEIKGKTVVCLLSGGNNDILRYPEIMERSLVYQGRKHYLILEFTQKPGQLRNFVDKALGPTDDIVRFEYMKKTNKEKGAALVGIELKDKKDLEPLLKRMKAIELNFRILNSKELLYDYLI